MRAVLAITLALSACSFRLPDAEEIDGGPEPDPDPDPGAEPPECEPGFLDLCDQPEPSAAFVVSGQETIDTDNDDRCITLPQTGGRDVCLIYATEVTITTSGVLTAIGQRPLAIASTSTVSVAGRIDVSSQRNPARTGAGANDASCSFAQAPLNDLGGAGGGAGGTFTANGGDGGTGDTDTSSGDPDIDADPGLHGPAVAVANVTFLRGGCPGQRGGDEGNRGSDGDGGNGGSSGGALYLFAEQTLEIAGEIRATGAGGSGGEVQAGGGGGGSGGLIIVESDGATISGQISANGGGGGQGGGRLVSPTQTFEISGNPGTDGDLGTSGAPGGSSVDIRFGFGGAGAAGTTAAVNGASVSLGGGGGGGGAGLIRIIGPLTSSGTVSPPSQ